jgi:protocatechuate 3,4-dioxygenase beta subunit
MRYSLAAFALVVFPLFCQQAKDEKKCTFQGQVLNGVTNEPIKKADLVLLPTNVPGMIMYSTGSGAAPVKGSYSATTDAAGKYAFENVEPGTYSLSVQRQGFLNQRYGARGPTSSGTPLTVTAGQVLKDLLIKLTPQGAISGRVLDDEGEPVQNVSVQALTERTMTAGKRAFVPTVGGGSTNDRGEYRIANVPPGKYILSASPRQFGMQAPPKSADGKPEMGFVAVYYPSVTDQTQAAKVDVAPGAEVTGHDIRLRKARVVRVKGKIVDGATGKPAKDVMVSLSPRDTFTFGRNFSNVRGDDGQFEITNVAPGPYTLSVSNSSMIRTAASEPVDVGENDVEGLVITLKPGQNVTGSVVVVDKNGDEKVPLGTMRVSLSPSQMTIVFGGLPSGTVQDDGSFSLPGALPGKYTVSIYGTPAGSYVKAVKLGSQELAGREVDWSSGVPPESIEITVSMKAAQVTGRVEQKDGGPVPGATIVLVPEDEARRKQMIYYKTSVADQTGSFTVKGIPPGEYKAYAWEQLEYGAYMDPEFMKPLESNGVNVKLNAGGSQAVQLKLIPPAP